MLVIFRSIVIQDVFAEHMFVFAHCEQVSGISNHDCVLTKGFAFDDLHEPNQESRDHFGVTSAANL